MTSRYALEIDSDGRVGLRHFACRQLTWEPHAVAALTCPTCELELEPLPERRATILAAIYRAVVAHHAKRNGFPQHARLPSA